MYNKGIWEPSEEYAKWLSKNFSKAVSNSMVKKNENQTNKEGQSTLVLKPLVSKKQK